MASRGEGQDLGMSRRSSRCKGGVSRGREELPPGNATMKRGSPTTERAGSRVIQAQGKSSSRRLVKKWCKWITKMNRRAFSALRVIRIQGELTSRMPQDFT